jgi:Zn finger protein HypA/HybF involved in hydrogenase expression
VTCGLGSVEPGTSLAHVAATRPPVSGFASRVRVPDSYSTLEAQTAESVVTGSDISAGTYCCTGCLEMIQVNSVDFLPPCPNCGSGEWDTIKSSDSKNDSYPDQ